MLVVESTGTGPQLIRVLPCAFEYIQQLACFICETDISTSDPQYCFKDDLEEHILMTISCVWLPVQDYEGQNRW